MIIVEWLWTQPGGKKGTCTAPSTIDRRISGTVVSARAEHEVRLEERRRPARPQPAQAAGDWCSALFGLTGEGVEEIPPSTSWLTMTVALRWQGTTWKMTDLQQRDGPEPD
ncbi:hypothetical protein ACFW5I_27555 [Streptomyces sp. NPDC058818]|uniref:hypothetical protein n=1 Tax=Streptomyces sp. NPDC058818 TaxID=3346640 RepID=UPI0036922169